MHFPRPSALVCTLLLPASGWVAAGTASRPDIDIRESLQPSPVKMIEDGGIVISGKADAGVGEVKIQVTRGTGGSTVAEIAVKDGRFSCRYPSDFSGAPALVPCLLYVDVQAGPDLLKQRAEASFIFTTRSGTMKPDLPSAFTDDFIDASGAKDSKASTWPVNRELVNLFMRSRGAKIAGIGREDFDLANAKDLRRFHEIATLYDFDHRDRDWSSPLNHRPGRAFWQAEWNRWFGPGNDHPWDGNPENRKPENYRPYTFTNDLADLLILHLMRRPMNGTAKDNRDAMCRESLANLIALQYRGDGNFARPGFGKHEHYTAGAFRYGFFETGEWLEEGTGWFISPKSADHLHGGVFNGRSAWALGEALKRDPSGPHAKAAEEALALVIRYCLHDGLERDYTKSVGERMPFWRQAGEHGYLTLGMIAAAEVKPDLPVVIDPAAPARPLSEVTAQSLNTLVEALNSEGHWTKYPDQDAMGLAALSEGALLFPKHRDAASWKKAAIRVADGWISAKTDASEKTSGGANFGRREGDRMTYHVGDKPEVHINLYISGLWLHALAKTYQLTGNTDYRRRAEGILAYLCGDNPFHVRLLNEMGAVQNIIRDTGDENSRLNWDCYPESTAFVQIGLLHWLDAIQSKP